MIFRKDLSQSRGILALDIDGTLTRRQTGLEEGMRQTLKHLNQSGWLIAFITGRTFSRAMQTLEGLEFPFLVSPQNGAACVQMPGRTLLWKHYIGWEQVEAVDRFSLASNSDFILYLGLEAEDVCYFRPDNFSSDFLEFFQWRKNQSLENWIETPSFSELGVKEAASLKWFGKEEPLSLLGERIEKEFSLKAPVIKDPFRQEIYILQATSPGVDKGVAAKKIQKIFSLENRPLIAAGDDRNDIPLLKAADYSYAMEWGGEQITNSASEVISCLESSLDLLVDRQSLD